MIKLSSHALDMIATHLSEFSAPNIPELTLRDGKTLQNNMLESIIGVFSGPGNAHVRHMMTNMVRRIFASCETYRLGRTHAQEYVSGEPHSRITPYFLALTFFESCVSYSWQVADLTHKLAKQDVFKKGDGSAWERLYGVYTHGTKHTFEKYDAVARPEIPTTVWLTNNGISCISGSTILYAELTEIIAANNDLFYDVQFKARERLKGSKKLDKGLS